MLTRKEHEQVVAAIGGMIQPVAYNCQGSVSLEGLLPLINSFTEIGFGSKLTKRNEGTYIETTWQKSGETP